jgi:organic radical activating enzyme
MISEQIISFIRELGKGCKEVIFTGGEPLLQLNKNYGVIQDLVNDNYRCIIETNGSQSIMESGICPLLYYVTCSPKVAEHCMRLEACDELRYVRGYGQPIPKPRINAAHKIISPAFEGSELDPKTLAWCIKLVKENPEWRLSVQQHKLWKVR